MGELEPVPPSNERMRVKAGVWSPSCAMEHLWLASSLEGRGKGARTSDPGLIHHLLRPWRGGFILEAIDYRRASESVSFAFAPLEELVIRR
jgi:hypothetical protein